MIDSFLKNIFGDLVMSKDGSLSLTKLAASTAHASCAAFFVYHNLMHGYTESLWIIYIGAAITHAAYDKTVNAFKKTEKPQDD